MQSELTFPDSNGCRTRIFTADEQLRQQIERALGGTGYRQLREIAVDVRDGIATLNGCVPSYYLKQVAQCAVMAVGEVGRVANDIEVACRRWDQSH
jgi:osmotically-inducible protein OsmY